MARSLVNLSLTLLFCLGILRLNFPPGIVSQGRPMNASEMEQFFDQVISAALAKYQIPGATVSVVQDGQLFIAKGYGLADVEHNIPVRAEQTLFRIGSTSKLFTWTAVMQLVEQGKLDLDKDVNAYLRDFQIPATYPQPVTLRHLMTHTAGFEERTMGMLAESSETTISMKDYLAQYMPARVFPPGQISAYSNYGAVLAGYIVSIVSGMPFEEYVEENIFRPLDMARTTFRQPLPAGMAEDLATGYNVVNGTPAPRPFEYFNGLAEGSASSTALDMARFMIAHLQDGEYDGARILQTATAEQMHRRQFANDPRLNGFAFGFFDVVQNRQHILEHGGGTMYFHTQLALLPEQNMGIFISYNSSGGKTAVVETFQAFMDHYYPVNKTLSVPVPKRTAERAAHFRGDYRWTRTNYTKIDRLSFIRGTGFGRVTANPDGSLTVAFQLPRGSFRGRFSEVEPLVFQGVDGEEKLIFKEDANGRVTTLLLNSSPHYAYEKIAWYETSWFSLRLVFFCLPLFLSVIFASFGGLILARRKPDLPRWVAFATSLLALVLTAGYGLSMGALPFGVTPGLFVLLGLSIAMPVLAALLLALALRAWAQGRWSPAARIHYTLVAVAAIAFAWILHAWNVLGFRL